MPLAKITRMGQVAIPADIRRALGLHTGDYVEITREESRSRIVLTPVAPIWRRPERDPTIPRLPFLKPKDLLISSGWGTRI
jgi:AbrB family looped-hinge helix DNA binding protein